MMGRSWFWFPSMELSCPTMWRSEWPVRLQRIPQGQYWEKPTFHTLIKTSLSYFMHPSGRAGHALIINGVRNTLARRQRRERTRENKGCWVRVRSINNHCYAINSARRARRANETCIRSRKSVEWYWRQRCGGWDLCVCLALAYIDEHDEAKLSFQPFSSLIEIHHIYNIPLQNISQLFERRTCPSTLILSGCFSHLRKQRSFGPSFSSFLSVKPFSTGHETKIFTYLLLRFHYLTLVQFGKPQERREKMLKLVEYFLNSPLLKVNFWECFYRLIRSYLQRSLRTIVSAAYRSFKGNELFSFWIVLHEMLTLLLAADHQNWWIHVISSFGCRM